MLVGSIKFNLVMTYCLCKSNKKRIDIKSITRYIHLLDLYNLELIT